MHVTFHSSSAKMLLSEINRTQKGKTDILRSIGNSPRESMESVVEKKRKASERRICRKGSL